MICKQKEAKVHLTKIVGDKMQKVDLCEECARSKGVDDPTGFSFEELLSGLGKPQDLAPITMGDELRCPSCGFSQADFKKSGRLGCADCYTTFAQGMEGLLKNMHKGTRHIGKTPRVLKQSRDISDRVKQLQKKLEKAIAVEDFEQAAVIRDEIKALKAQASADEVK
jgi:protein arginine kinase activator